MIRPRNIEAALDDLGIDYVIRGDEAQALCPNPDHDDRSPSWSCNLVTGVHHCFSCGFKGSFVSLVMIVKGVRRPVAEDYSRDFTRSNEELVARKNAGELAVPKVRQYSEVDLALFDWPPQRALDKRGITQVAVQTYGVLWDIPRELWILPVRDPYTRRLRGWQEKGDGHFKNVPYGMEKADCLFGYHLLKDGPVAVVESPLDALRVWQAGMQCVATYGASFSEAQADLLLRATDHLVDAFDDDKAGHKASGRLRAEYAHLFTRLREFHYGDTGAKDPGDMTDDQIREGIERAR